jgi:hypothetical protein
MIGGEWKRADGDRQGPLLAIELGTTLTSGSYWVRNWLISVA